MNLLEKLKQPENRKLEFKREIPGKSDLLKTLIAFANGADAPFSHGFSSNVRSCENVRSM